MEEKKTTNAKTPKINNLRNRELYIQKKRKGRE